MNESADIVGVGLATPIGSDPGAFWQGLFAPPTTAFLDLGDMSVPVRRATSCAEARYTPSEVRRMDGAHRLALPAAADAMADIPFELPSPDRCGVCVGVGYGGGEYGENQFRAFLDGGTRAVNPLTIPIMMPNSVAAHLSLAYGFTGPSTTYAMACASGAAAIGEALWLLRSGRIDFALAGGVDALLTPGIASFFARTGAMSTNVQDPECASRPFDVRRDGFVLGEGAAFVALVRSSDQRAGGKRFGQVLGYGATSDSHHLVAPSPSGAGAASCMRQALTDAGMSRGDIGHVNAHGTSTRQNDVTESQAVDTVFGAHRPAVTSAKGATGHLIGASGAVEAIATMYSATKGFVPPVWGLSTLDPEVRIDVVQGEGREIQKRIGLSNSFGFGGHNACLIIGP